MKKAWQILGRLFKVVYVLLLLLGIGVGWLIWTENTPYTYQSYSYQVECTKGEGDWHVVFDPTSKPINKLSYIEPYTFDDLQLKSECEYGTAFYVGLSSKLAKNYSVTYKVHNHVVRTASDQINNVLIGVVIYYVLLEIVRRTLLYIFSGRNFFTLKIRNPL